MYDLILKGGDVLDPSQNLKGRRDVAIAEGRIAKIAPSIQDIAAHKVLDVHGKMVVPGLVDIHTHVYHPGRNTHHPDTAGVLAGVTTVADAGGPGASNYDDFCNIVLGQARTTVYSFISLFSDRTIQSAHPSQADLDLEGAIRVAKENPQVVKGIKLIVAPSTVQTFGIDMVKMGCYVAREAGVRIMMHIGDIGPRNQKPTPSALTAQALSLLSPGDIVTHIFTPLTGASLDEQGQVLPQLKEAAARGVFLDTSYGDFNFGWERADTVLSQGVMPDTIGTDIEIHAGGGMRKLWERGLVEYMAFFLALGFSVEDVIRMTTVNPARALGIEDTAGSLAVGRTADVSVLDLIEGEYRLTDATGKSRTGTQAFIPVVTIKGGQVIEPGEAPHAWGWLPPAVATVAVDGGS